MLGIIKNSNHDKIAKLERIVNERRAALEEVKAAFIAARTKADADDDAVSAAHLDGASAEAIDLAEQRHALALRRVHALAAAIERGSQALADGERELAAETERGVRARTAKRLTDAADGLEQAIANLQKPMAAVLAALDSASFQEVTHEIAPALFAQHMTRASQALAGGDGERFVEVLRNLADRIVAGEADFRLRPTLAEEATALRKSA